MINLTKRSQKPALNILNALVNSVVVKTWYQCNPDSLNLRPNLLLIQNKKGLIG